MGPSLHISLSESCLSLYPIQVVNQMYQRAFRWKTVLASRVFLLWRCESLEEIEPLEWCWHADLGKLTFLRDTGQVQGSGIPTVYCQPLGLNHTYGLVKEFFGQKRYLQSIAPIKQGGCSFTQSCHSIYSSGSTSHVRLFFQGCFTYLL